MRKTSINYKPIIQKFKGLDPTTSYRVIVDGEEREGLFTGTALMQIGIPVRTIKYECDSTRIEIEAVN